MGFARGEGAEDGRVEGGPLVEVQGAGVDCDRAAGRVGGGPAQLDLDNTTASNNGNTGILSQNPTALVRVNNTTIAHNGGAGVVSLSGGQILSFGNNRSMANAAGDGAATGAAATVF